MNTGEYRSRGYGMQERASGSGVGNMIHRADGEKNGEEEREWDMGGENR